ncbi:unnamed protein product [Cladocopium goreaui]|uniref:Spore wall protein 2 n=1 Tax=Cladocopium goreaui TaxID=2562237 RepID=A0A9P1FKP1_9DINO|nr:unnamed protein product [Cladocopium goreaui]
MGEKRLRWARDWLEKTVSNKVVRVGEFRSALGRLAFMMSAFTHLKPLLAPLCSWITAVDHCNTLQAPAAVHWRQLWPSRQKLGVPNGSMCPRRLVTRLLTTKLPLRGAHAAGVDTSSPGFGTQELLEDQFKELLELGGELFDEVKELRKKKRKEGLIKSLLKLKDASLISPW